MSESFAQLLEESGFDEKVLPGKLIKGRVLSVGQDTVTVDAGLKSEAYIPVDQFRDNHGDINIEAGDLVEVSLEQVEDGYGETILSREKAVVLKTWEEIEKAHENNSNISGAVVSSVRGGFAVDISGVRGFLPGSLADVKPVRDPADYLGQVFDFRVVKLDVKRNNVVVSRRAVLEEENRADREELLKDLEEGMVIKGVVKNLTDYGAFVDLGGIDGLLHITDMSWKRIKKPSDIINLGDEIEVKVLKFDRERCRVSLGLKQLGEDPWQGIASRYPVGAKLSGKVTNITDYGFFVEIEEGIEGLVHVSEVDWTNKNINPFKAVHVGEEVEVMILDLDTEKRRISLGMKQCKPNPWEEFAVMHNKGDKIKGVIKSITDFGIFVGLENGIDGLLHISDLSWDESGEEAVKRYEKGQEIEAVVLSVDTARERISLGVKQLESDPFSAYIAEHGKGSIVKGQVSAVEQKMVTVSLDGGVEGQIRASELSDERVEDARSVCKEGDEIEARITNIDRKNRIVVLSVRAKDEALEAEAVREYGNAEIFKGTSSLGDLLKEQMKNDSDENTKA
ncbi:MAG: 30S ribosomal protein S1 [Gammaproteobacteria bacterium]|nr:MAG: 30S ribosomal protein S1 [Gammaproteobacteria bacterium]